jgi:hypothetical protein
MDSKLWYNEHVAKAVTKGLVVAMTLRRLRMVNPVTARQLFGATVAPVVNYDFDVWIHICGSAAMAAMNRVQRIGAQVVIGLFRTASTAIAEA